jgi:general secretion pathway protein G
MDRRQKARGFTLIELMVVISIMLILVTVAVPLIAQNIRRSREAVLAQDLKIMREQIQHFIGDKRRAPQSLEELVTEEYIAAIPVDPVTGRADTWVVEHERSDSAVDSAQVGIRNVRSGSDATSSEGTPYRSW